MLCDGDRKIIVKELLERVVLYIYRYYETSNMEDLVNKTYEFTKNKNNNKERVVYYLENPSYIKVRGNYLDLLKNKEKKVKRIIRKIVKKLKRQKKIY